MVLLPPSSPRLLQGPHRDREEAWTHQDRVETVEMTLRADGPRAQHDYRDEESERDEPRREQLAERRCSVSSLNQRRTVLSGKANA